MQVITFNLAALWLATSCTKNNIGYRWTVNLIRTKKRAKVNLRRWGFDLNKINSFYSEWIQKAVTGTFDDECYCYFEDDKPLGFCTIRYNQNNSVSIGLFGVGSNYTGKGIGKSLLRYVISEMKLKGIMDVKVVTQGRNYSAQNLYQSVGFKTFTTELWYHKWVN